MRIVWKILRVAWRVVSTTLLIVLMCAVLMVVIFPEGWMPLLRMPLVWLRGL